MNYVKAHQQTAQMPEDLQMMSIIKQEPPEPVEWSDFEHENASLNKSSIEVAVKPELYSKGDTDEEGILMFIFIGFIFFFQVL